ncbi:phage holin [Hoyosella altamirensis]|uniref:Holin n=1 Tax=Hoyosella altamirensis TaxID=616997 RepID=A0A839RS73_9ACTN|nr:hypothetical protein [Hoyosella altamirensis]MBB3039802.1 hypothetical protein [Hoyosella altamirensis]
MPKVPDYIRGRIYSGITFALPLLAMYGILEEQEVALWVGLAGALLGTGLAAVNTPQSPRPTLRTELVDVPVDDPPMEWSER